MSSLGEVSDQQVNVKENVMEKEDVNFGNSEPMAGQALVMLMKWASEKVPTLTQDRLSVEYNNLLAQTDVYCHNSLVYHNFQYNFRLYIVN